MSQYDIADRAKLQGTFYADGSPTDPDNVELQIKTPTGTTSSHVYGTDPDVIKDSTGVYYYLLQLTASGQYYYRWEGSGTLYAGGEKRLVVNQSQFY